MKKLLLIGSFLVLAAGAFSQIQDINNGESALSVRNKLNGNFDYLDAKATASGTDTYTATISPAITSYVTGQRYFITFTNANTGAATINFNSLGAKAIKKSGTTALSSGDISAGQTLCLVYDGTNMQIVGGVGSGGFTSPMTTAGDIIVGGASGTPTRLAAGSTSGHVLTSNGSGVAPSWQAPSGGGGGGLSGLTSGRIPFATSGTTIANTPYQYAASGVYTATNSFQARPRNTGGSGSNELEIVNLGNMAATSDNIASNETALVRMNGRLLLIRNMRYDSTNVKWLTPDQTATAYGSSCFEAGGEATILHATPSGVNFSDVPHEILLASANGTDGGAAESQSSGYYNQIKAPLWGRYSSAAYVPATTANVWNPSTAADPIIWISSGEAKGTSGTHDYQELQKIEGNGASSWGALNFASSNGTHASKTVVSLGKIIGSIGSKSWDGFAWQRTANLEFYTTGSSSSGTSPQGIRFSTGSTNTASVTAKLEIEDLVTKQYLNNPTHFRYTGITTIPDFSGFAGFSPTLNNNTIGRINALSTSTGGTMFTGISTTSTAGTAIALWHRAVLGANSPTAPATVFQVLKHDGSTSVTDLSLTNIGWEYRNNATAVLQINGGGKIFNNPTNTAAGTTGAQTINKPSGTVNFAAGASTLVVTNSLVTTSSIVFAVVRTNDATALIKNVVPASGSFTITLNAAATAETSVGFFVIN